MTEPETYLNGRFIPQSQASLSLHDAGFVLGATVTDLCRTFGQRLYRWEDHLRRFRASCRLAHLDPQFTEAEMTSLAHELVRRNASILPTTQELCLVMFATPGPVGYYLGYSGGAGDSAPTFGMHTFPLPRDRYRRLIKNGADLVIPQIRQVPSNCVDPRIKQRSRLHWWLADREVQSLRPGAQALLIDEAGHVTETAAANFVIVQGDVVVSPPVGDVLPGVSLQVVRELCHRLVIGFQERPLSVAECAAANEAMLTSTAYCLAGVRSLNGNGLPFPGPVFQRLRDAWSEEIGTSIHAAFCPGIP